MAFKKDLSGSWFERQQSLMVWLMFSLAMAIVPLVVRSCALYIDTSKSLSLNGVLGDGGLFLIAGAVAGETIGEAFALLRNNRASLFYVFSAGTSLITAVLTAGLWGFQEALADGIDHGAVCVLSLLSFAYAVGVSAVTRFRIGSKGDGMQQALK